MSARAASVVLNTYGDRAELLEEAIASYLAQDGVEVQVIVSTVESDPAVELVRSRFGGDGRVEICVTPRSEHPGFGFRGIYVQLNRAIRRMRHGWFTYASGHDVALATKLRDEIRLCEERGKLVCYSSFYLTDGALRIRKQARFHDYDASRHLRGNFVSDCAIVHRSLIEKHGPFRLEHENHAFWDFWLRIHGAEGDVFVYNPEPEWLYRGSRESHPVRWRLGLRGLIADEIARERMIAEHRGATRRASGGLGAAGWLRVGARVGRRTAGACIALAKGES